MEIVFDTNVLVSGLLQPKSAPGEIIDLVFGEAVTPVFDDRILYEYRDVLVRPKFAFPLYIVEDLLNAITTIGRQVIAVHTSISLPDENDRCFYECAQTTSSQTLVTGNKKHFPAHKCPAIRVFSPREFLEGLEKK